MLSSPKTLRWLGLILIAIMLVLVAFLAKDRHPIPAQQSPQCRTWYARARTAADSAIIDRTRAGNRRLFGKWTCGDERLGLSHPPA
jgi:hypothetical protein